MNQRRVKIENSIHQLQEFGIDEYENHIVLGSFFSAEIENVEIQETIEGKPITEIGDGCFFNCPAMKSISIPGTIYSIGIQAFALCKGLSELILPDSIKEIGAFAFRDCYGLKKVVMPKTLKVLSNGLFSFCHLQDPEIVLPAELEFIERDAFLSAGTFEIQIPDSVKGIGVGAFYFGPYPVTKHPYDKGWFSEWPYGERVITDDNEGKITDIKYFEVECRLHEVVIGTEIRNYFYPCDYMDGRISFMDEDNQQRLNNCIKDIWDSDEKKKEAYKVSDAWRRGFIKP